MNSKTVVPTLLKKTGSWCPPHWYVKDEAQLTAEMEEAMEALAAKAKALEAENALLKAKLGIA
jgi:hypothetical protein